MPLILKTGYEQAIRTKLGVNTSELPDGDINQPLIVDLAEQVIIGRVPDYGSITSSVDTLYLQGAIVSYICYMLAPSMANRVKSKIATLDTRWEKSKVDWQERAQEFLAEMETHLGNITTVDVITADFQIFGISRKEAEGTT